MFSHDLGLFQTYRIAGGEAGMRHFLAQFGPCLKWPWTKLTDVVDLDEALIEKIAVQSDKQAAGLCIRELERIREENLVGMLQSLQASHDGDGWGAGKLLAEFEQRLLASAPAAALVWSEAPLSGRARGAPLGRRALRRNRNQPADKNRRSRRLAVGRSAGRLDRGRIGRACDDGGIVRRQARAARRVPDHAERARRAEFRVNDPEFVRLAGRRLRRDWWNRELLLVEIDRHLDGRRSRVFLQDRHIFAWGRLPGRLTRNESDRQHASENR